MMEVLEHKALFNSILFREISNIDFLLQGNFTCIKRACVFQRAVFNIKYVNILHIHSFLRSFLRSFVHSFNSTTYIMIQMVDRPNTTPIGQDKKTLTFKALL